MLMMMLLEPQLKDQLEQMLKITQTTTNGVKSQIVILVIPEVVFAKVNILDSLIGLKTASPRADITFQFAMLL